MPRCLKCDNTGVAIEYRLVWKVRRDDGSLGDGSLLVPSESEGWAEAAKLGEKAVDVDVVSGARKCICRMVRQVRPQKQKPESRDWKMAQAGKD